MNANHYPSLELCKKLTEIGFPEGDFFIEPTSMKIVSIDLIDYICGGITDGFYSRPSVMEMLDAIPTIGWDTPKIIKNYLGWYVVYEGENHEIIWAGGNKGQFDNLPNALAEMILWLHKNNYITFNKKYETI